MIATANGPWWQTVMAGRSWADAGSWGFAAASFVALVALHFALLATLAHRWLVRPLLTLAVIVAAVAAYYMRTFAVILDPTMIQNVLRTDVREARDLLNWSMLAWVAASSALPVAIIWWVRLARPGMARALLRRAGAVLAALLVAALALLAVARDLTSLMRNQHEARYLITPGNVLYGLGLNSLRRVVDANTPREALGRDAAVLRVSMTARPRVLVLVVGETARAANFSLLGYARLTNPELALRDVISFGQVSACGTSTEVSLPCMFSARGREDYDERRIRNSEGLLDVLVHAGYIVKWIDNQSGCKGVCAGGGIEVSRPDVRTAPGLCAGDECYDGALVQRLKGELESIRGDTVIALHMMGNHGPAYFKRYPPQFRRFTPDCRTAQLRDCTREQVVNAYDNAILYTDHVLASLVDVLQNSSADIDSALLYVSDHGESLGEKGLYLHGIPYAIAPSQQTHVPMLLWLSAALTDSGDVNAHCLRARVDRAYSHDNLFHSVLGLLNVSTSAYRAERDIFEGCRGGTIRSRRIAGAFSEPASRSPARSPRRPRRGRTRGLQVADRRTGLLRQDPVSGERLGHGFGRLSGVQQRATQLDARDAGVDVLRRERR
ncbi:MAG: phosphoethanolamine--lipid A transferase [Sinobacteraceae bacterium]|nr:phosphoethanolamine--lipid A transferase [Nevskiaceae bacterium]MCP5339291.1 phosphoethanolamine--lipid A transferase [Nevskiaceae bacterium]MCP5359359.1 phosphoethanolamine--lipid A transferase [Nevskiaceae bacterium]MCP5470797.1 phosphoethanolamine--lipid A transferase [Nevskiaceae bacterium]